MEGYCNGGQNSWRVPTKCQKKKKKKKKKFIAPALTKNNNNNRCRLT